MSSRVIQIADFVVAQLNTFAQASESAGSPIVVERKYNPIYSLEELSQKIVLCVVPRTKVGNNVSRADREIDLQIDVGIMHRPEDLSENQLDELMQFVEDAEDHLYDVDWKAANIGFFGIANDPIYSPEHLTENRQFSSLLTINCRYWRPRKKP